MAVRDDKMRVSLTMPRETVEVVRAEAEKLGLTMSQYVVLTMRANSFLGDDRVADIANYQLQRFRDASWGYEETDFDKRHRGLMALDC